MGFQQEPRCSEALAEMYALLNEEDVLAGLWKKRWTAGDPQLVPDNVLQETRAVVTLIQHGLFERAEEWLINLFRRTNPGGAGLKIRFCKIAVCVCACVHVYMCVCVCVQSINLPRIEE